MVSLGRKHTTLGSGGTVRRTQLASGTVVISLKGYFTGGEETSVLEGELKALIDEGVDGIIIDCSEVQHFNSQALGTLFEAKNELRAAGRKIDLVGISRRIENVFVVTKLSLVFDVWTSVEQADDAIVARRKESNQPASEAR